MSLGLTIKHSTCYFHTTEKKIYDFVSQFYARHNVIMSSFLTQVNNLSWKWHLKKFFHVQHVSRKKIGDYFTSVRLQNINITLYKCESSKIPVTWQDMQESEVRNLA